MRWKYPKSECRNVYSLRNKVLDLREIEIVSHVQFEDFVISETKVYHSFSSAKFKLVYFEIGLIT